MALLAAALTLAGCTPAFNWREVALDGAGLRVLLPCKPDRGERDVPIGPAHLHLHMAGCEAGGVLFAVAHATVPDGLPPQAVVDAWRAATLAGMQASERPAGDAAVRLRTSGHRPDGRAVHAQAVWRVLAGRTPVQVMQAVVYSDEPLPDEAADTFFGSVDAR